MKIKELSLLPREWKGGWYTGTNRLALIAWKDPILEEIHGSHLILMAKPGSKEAGKKVSTNFFIETYNNLNPKNREIINQIFTENIGRTIAEILELEISF